MEMSKSHSHCFLSISVAGQPARTVVIHLFPETCPKACENFVQLCSSPLKTSKVKPQPSYRGTEFHRIVDNFMVQAGDFEKFDGSGGYSPLTCSTFPDESFTIRHDRPGRVSMANRGPNTNGSQFFITLSAATSSHLDGKHVCFGQVVEGMDVVHAMTAVEREGSQPAALQRIIVVDCGVGRGTTSDLHGCDKDDNGERTKARKEWKKKKSYQEHDDSSREPKRKQKKNRRKDYDSSPEQKKKHKRHRRQDDTSDFSYEDKRKKKRSKREYDSQSSDGAREHRKINHKSFRP
jgi:cyclophilin family peptidyl-prolyl cis-trans isomerase